MKLSALALLLALSNLLSAQFSPIIGEIKERMATTTLEIVLTGDDAFDKALRKVVPQELTSYSYVFLTQEEFAAKHKKKDKIVALVKARGDFQFRIPGYETALFDVPFFGVVHRYPKDEVYQDRAEIAGYTLDIPGEEEFDLDTALRVYLRSLNNDQLEPAKSDLKARKKHVSTQTYLVPDWWTQSPIEALREEYPYTLELADKGRFKEALRNKEDVLISITSMLTTTQGLGETDIMFTYWINAADGTLVYTDVQAFQAKKDAEKYVELRAKNEVKALKAFAREVK